MDMYCFFVQRMYFCRFRLTYRLILREKELHFNIAVYNPSKDLTFSFNMLLHTYFKVPDVRRCQITGLQGCTFIDKTRDGTVYQEVRHNFLCFTKLSIIINYAFFTLINCNLYIFYL